ncbi:unnamed protein product [Mytilus coruscus]|uniref:DUF4371 domain-containing protein n=1 Tax=Mytilus coruscus TaxID=42192 RepID=A0A6J8DX80_MYTCO|nr:unnamed protein product [Mytilus coruscus]
MREEFLGFVKASATTGEVLADLFISTLEQYGIQIGNMRAQGYDGTANTSGIHKGVQARIKEIVPTANYVHCKAHVLNLAIVHASQDPSVRTMMATIQEIAFSFHYSAKKLGKLQDELEQNQNVKDKLDGKTKIQTLCETRWFSRASDLSTFKATFPVIVSFLEYLQSKGDGKSGVQLSAILRFDFILPLVIINHILEAIVPLTSMLQGVSCDLMEAKLPVFVHYAVCHHNRMSTLVFILCLLINYKIDFKPSKPEISFSKQLENLDDVSAKDSNNIVDIKTSTINICGGKPRYIVVLVMLEDSWIFLLAKAILPEKTNAIVFEYILDEIPQLCSYNGISVLNLQVTEN